MYSEIDIWICLAIKIMSKTPEHFVATNKILYQRTSPHGRDILHVIHIVSRHG